MTAIYCIAAFIVGASLSAYIGYRYVSYYKDMYDWALEQWELAEPVD